MTDFPFQSDFDKGNAWYPAHVSDRADTLIDELDATQLRRLWETLKHKTLHQWMRWLEESRAAISHYDGLRPAERNRRLASATSLEALELHHACIFVELWRARLSKDYLSLPPNGLPLDTPSAHRNMLLAAVASYYAFELGDLWPFDYPEGEEGWPFAEEA